MSAYMVDRAHIDAIVTTAMTLRHYGSDFSFWVGGSDGRLSVNQSTADRVGQLLVDANLASVEHRYPDSAEDGDLPGPLVQWYRQPYTWERTRVLTDVELAKAIGGFGYQACEHDGWDGSPAELFCRAVIDAIVSRMPGWDEASTWNIDADNAAYAVLAA